MMNENYSGVEPQKNQIAPKARTESADSLGSKSESRTSLAGQPDDKAGDLGQVKFTKNTDEAAVEIGAVDVAFAGMGKEELMKYANDPFWVRLRWALFALFWLAWLGMLAAAIVIVVLAPKCPAPAPLDYWQKGAVYSVNPKSYQDSGAVQDGKGDLKGIVGRMTHLKHLGVNMISVSPVFETANEEPLYGQDVVDFRKVKGTYGSLQDMKDLIEVGKQDGVKIILDIVLNHVSKSHPWFNDSVYNQNGCDDCFIWRDGKNNNNEPPNNWASIFGGSAWTKDATKNKYYYHVYGPNQPDLNLRSAKVMNETKEVLHFWLKQGVSGFRLLSVPFLYESSNTTLNETPIPGAPPNKYSSLKHEHTTNLKETFDFLGEIRAILDEYELVDGEHRVLIVEAENTEEVDAMKYYGDDEKPLADLVINPNFVTLKEGFSADELEKKVSGYLQFTNQTQRTWPNWMLGNGDTNRVASRLDPRQVEAVAMVQLLLPGTAFVYYGDEIGMEDVPPPSGGPVACPSGDELTANSRCDRARSPFRWDSSLHAGFTNATNPWYPIGDHVDTINAKTQMANTESTMNVFRELVALRKQPAHMFGTFNILHVNNADVFAFTRIRKGAPGYLVLLNTKDGEVSFNCSTVGSIPAEAQTVVRSSTATNNSTMKGNKVDTTKIPLGPLEGLILSFIPQF